MNPNSHLDRDDQLDAWLREGYGELVAEFSNPAHLPEVLSEVKREGHQRRIARGMVISPAGGLLVNHALIEIARYFRRDQPGEVDILQVCQATGIPLNDCRAVLRQFVVAGLLIERLEPAREGAPPRRLYELTDEGASETGGIVALADVLLRQQEGDGRRRIGEINWEGA